MAKKQLKDSKYHLNPAEIKRGIYATRSFRDRCLVKTLAHTALRRAELTSLDVRDLDFTRNLLQVREGKGGKSRTAPMSEELGQRPHTPHRPQKSWRSVSVAEKRPIDSKAGQLDSGPGRPGERRSESEPGTSIHNVPSLQAQLRAGMEKTRRVNRDSLENTWPH